MTRKHFASLPGTRIDADGHGVIRQDDRKRFTPLPTICPPGASAAQGQKAKWGENVNHRKHDYGHKGHAHMNAGSYLAGPNPGRHVDTA